MNAEIIWKLLEWACAAIRFVTRRKPNKGRLLVVEDDARDAELFQLRLGKAGWECEIASSGEVAQGMVAHTFYSVAFVDMRLPGMPGEAVVRLLSRQTPNTRIVIVCGEPQDLMKLPENEGVYFIRKPPSAEALVKVLRTLKA